MQRPTNITVKYVTSSDGTKVYAEAVGQPANPSLVLAHGFGSSATVFNELFANEELSKNFYLVGEHLPSAR